MTCQPKANFFLLLLSQASSNRKGTDPKLSMLAVSYFGVPGKCRLPGVAVPLNMLGTTNTCHAPFPLQYYVLQHSKRTREIEHFFHCVQNFCSMYTQLLFCLTGRSRTSSQPSNLCQVIPVSQVFFFSAAP